MTRWTSRRVTGCPKYWRSWTDAAPKLLEP